MTWSEIWEHLGRVERLMTALVAREGRVRLTVDELERANNEYGLEMRSDGKIVYVQLKPIAKEEDPAADIIVPKLQVKGGPQ
jgi:hypothetical protein